MTALNATATTAPRASTRRRATRPRSRALGRTAQSARSPAAAAVREIAAFPNGDVLQPAARRRRDARDPVRGRTARSSCSGRRPRSSVLPGLTVHADRHPRDLQQPDVPRQVRQRRRRPRLFVTCFADGEIYVYDPALPRLVKTFSVGRGPLGAGVRRHARPQVAYVVGFGDNNISVIDLAPGSPTEYHVIQRIGFPESHPAMTRPPSVPDRPAELRCRPPRARPRPTSCPTNDLNRPTDIAFMCLGAFGRPAPTPTAARRRPVRSRCPAGR